MENKNKKLIIKKYVDELKEELFVQPEKVSKRNKLYISREALISFIDEFTEEFFENPACYMMPDWRTKKDVLRGKEFRITTAELDSVMRNVAKNYKRQL